MSGKSVMVPPKAGTFGTMGRNIFRDTGFKNVDFSVCKTFKKLVLVFETNASFRNPALDFQIPCRFSKPNTSFQNPALNFEILRWFLKTGTGFQNPALDSQIPR